MSFIYWPTRDSICLPDAEATFEALSRHVILGVGTKNQQAGNYVIANYVINYEGNYWAEHAGYSSAWVGESSA